MNLGAKGFYKTLMGLVLVFLMFLVYAGIARAELFMSISGTVKDAASGRGIAGVKVVVGDYVDKVFKAQTDGQGNYLIKMVPEGQYDVIAFAPEASVYVNKSYTKNVKVEKGKNVVDANFELPLAGAVIGTIYQSDGVTPLANAEINAFTNKGFATSSTDSQGRYILFGLPPDPAATLWISTYGYGVIEKNNINIAAGQITPDINIVLPSANSGLRGVVSTLDSVGVPIEQVIVLLGNDQNFGLTLTDVNGNYEIKGLTPGVYKAIVLRYGFTIRSIENVTILKEGFTNLNVSLMTDTSLNQTELFFNNTPGFHSIISPKDELDYPEMRIQLVANNWNTYCDVISLSWVPPRGEALSLSYCEYQKDCGQNKSCTMIKWVKSTCLCSGFDVSVSIGRQFCKTIPTEGKNCSRDVNTIIVSFNTNPDTGKLECLTFPIGAKGWTVGSVCSCDCVFLN